MTEPISAVLDRLKLAGFSNQKIEKALGFSNGLLGKAASGKLKLSEEKFSALMEFANRAGAKVGESIADVLNPIKIPIPAVNTVLVLAEGEKERMEAIQRLKDGIGLKTANEVPVPEKKPEITFYIQENAKIHTNIGEQVFHIKSQAWVVEMEAYCEAIGITPMDLVAWHKDAVKSVKKAAGRTAIQDEVGAGILKAVRGNDKYLQELRRTKLGMKD